MNEEARYSITYCEAANWGMPYPINRLPIIVAHRSNSYNKIRSLIASGVVDTVEIDVIRSPRDGNIIMQHMGEEEFTRDFVVRKEKALAINEEGVIEKLFQKTIQSLLWSLPVKTIIDGSF